MSVYALGLVFVALVLGTFSSLLFLWQWVAGAPTQLSALILLAAVTGVFLKLFFYLKPGISRSRVSPRKHWMFRLVPPACLSIAVAYAGIGVARVAEQLPSGFWDAFAVWNLHSRFLYRGRSGAWTGMFDPALFGTNGDYPLLLPGLVEGAWMLAGTEQAIISALLAIGLGALIVGILWSSVSAVAGNERGCLAGLLLLAAPSFLRLFPAQTADLPIALYILTTMVLLQFAEAWPKIRRPMLALAGLSAGFAAWTKNEGLLFVVAVLASQFAALVLLRRWRDLRSHFAWIGLGLAPMLALVLSYKTLLAPLNNPLATLGYVSSPVRYREILMGFYHVARGFGGAIEGGLHPVVLVALFLLLYAGPIRHLRPTSLSLALFIPIMLGGYFLVYLFSSFGSVEGYMQGSLGRLCLQLWPASVFFVATLLPTPADTAGK